MNMEAPVTAPPSEDAWKIKYKKMKRKCREMENNNIVLSKRIRSINEVVQQVEVETRQLKGRLKFYNDDYTMPMSPKTRARTLLKTQAQLANDRLLSASEAAPPDVASTSSKGATVKPKTKPSSETAAKKSAASSSGKSDKPAKEKDPNAPKKPSNAFFWFCQEKRSEVQDMLAREGNTGHHDLAKVLSKMWGEATAADKKHYKQLYEEDKKRYEREQKAYQQLKDGEATKDIKTEPSTDRTPITQN